jgi:hypothetical protein
MQKIKLYLQITKIYLQIAYNYLCTPLYILFGIILGIIYMFRVKFSDYKDIDGKFNVINFALDGKDWILKNLNLYAKHFTYIFFLIILAIILYK